MTDQIGKYNMNNTLLLEDAFSVKEEDCENDDFSDAKFDISETAIITDNPELEDHSFPVEIKHYDPLTTLDNIKMELLSSKAQHGMTEVNLKIEDEISPNDIKIEFNNELLYCEDCHVYCEDYCANCGMLVHILNKAALVKAENTSQEELPNDSILEIQDSFGEFHVFLLKVVPAGVRFGPFTGLDSTEHSWKIKGGKFVVDKDKSKFLNWMQYINHARNISEQNLLVFQYENNLYYQSTRQIQGGDELLVYFGEEYEDSLNRNIEMNFIPVTEYIFRDVFACTICCLGFSSKSYLVKHKTICSTKADGGFSIEEVVKCPSCKIHLDQKEYFIHHMAYCCERSERKYILSTTDDGKTVNGRKTRPRLFYRCQQCKYGTKYKGDLENHANQHCEVKIFKCGVCCRRFKTNEVLRLHVENAHIYADGNEDWKPSTGNYTDRHIKAEDSRLLDEIEQFQCSLCEFRTKYKTSLNRHVSEKHLKKCSFKCDVCDYKSNRKSNIQEHIEVTHLRKFKYKCDTCYYKTNRKSHLKKHIERKHMKEFKYKCETYEYKTDQRSPLKRYVEEKHVKRIMYKCEACEYKTHQKSLLNRHIEGKHMKKFKYKCGTCEYKANQKCHLKTHIETKHLKEFKHKCHACDYKSNFRSDLEKHIESKHSKEFKYKCESCEYKAKRKYYLKVHIEERHVKDFKYKCDSCEYKTNQKPHLKMHVETKHVREFKYKCETCSFKSNWKCDLKRHIVRKHLREFKHECDMCDYKTYTKFNLKIHVEARHLREFKFKCDACEYKANRKSHLKRHVQLKHLKEFKYKCDECDFKTNLKPHLAMHIERRHLTEFKYKCDKCNFNTNYKSHLKRHIEGKHLKEFNHKCHMCDYKTYINSNLKRHIEAKHNNDFAALA